MSNTKHLKTGGAGNSSSAPLDKVEEKSEPMTSPRAAASAPRQEQRAGLNGHGKAEGDSAARSVASHARMPGGESVVIERYRLVQHDGASSRYDDAREDASARPSAHASHEQQRQRQRSTSADGSTGHKQGAPHAAPALLISAPAATGTVSGASTGGVSQSIATPAGYGTTLAAQDEDVRAAVKDWPGYHKQQDQLLAQQHHQDQQQHETSEQPSQSGAGAGAAAKDGQPGAAGTGAPAAASSGGRDVGAPAEAERAGGPQPPSSVSGEGTTRANGPIKRWRAKAAALMRRAAVKLARRGRE